MNKGRVSLEHANFAAKKISRKTSAPVQVRQLGPADFGVFVVDPAKHSQGPGGVLVAQFHKGERT
jgi:hypothetical protein